MAKRPPENPYAEAEKRLTEKIKTIFSSVYDLSITNATCRFKIYGNETTFVNMMALADLLKTDKINFTGRTEERRWSTYTVDTETYSEIECFDIFLL